MLRGIPVEAQSRRDHFEILWLHLLALSFSGIDYANSELNCYFFKICAKNVAHLVEYLSSMKKALDLVLLTWQNGICL